MSIKQMSAKELAEFNAELKSLELSRGKWELITNALQMVADIWKHTSNQVLYPEVGYDLRQQAQKLQELADTTACLAHFISARKEVTDWRK
jgi:hypothetical protein